MGILDNDTVIVDAILTKIGRQKLAQGQPLGITKFAFGDTGVDYTLYNPNHPSGSDSYGTAITSLPMLEAVPDDNVFMRTLLYGTGARNVQNFARIIASADNGGTIAKSAGKAKSEPINILPRLSDRDNAEIFNFKILDARGIIINGQEPKFGTTHTEAEIVNVSSRDLKLNAVATQFKSDKSFGVEITFLGAAPVFLAITVEANNVA
jgi:hypothetical protein